jgi:hypothetical protein
MHEGAHYSAYGTPIFMTPNDSGQVLLIDHGDTANYVKSHKDLIIGNNKYINCIEIRWNGPFFQTGSSGHAGMRALWWCKNIGLVQMLYTDSTVWQLLDYQINR